MSNILKQIVPSCKQVSKQAKHVKINYEKLDEIIALFDTTKMSCWLESNPFSIMQMEIKDLINFLFIYHAIGDFSLFGDPKWEIETEKGKLDGTFAMLYLIKKEYLTFTKKDLSRYYRGVFRISRPYNRYKML